MATKTEFIAAGRDPGEVAAALGADHVLYLDREAMNHRRIPDRRHHPRGAGTIGSERDHSRQKLFSFSG